DVTSSAGYVFPAAELKKEGIDPDKDVQGVTIKGHDAAIMALLNGQVDAVAVFQDARNTVKKDVPDVFEKTRVLHYTAKIPNDTVSVRNDMDQSWRDKISQAFIDITNDAEGAQIIKDIYTHVGYAKGDDKNFDPVREYAEAVGQEINWNLMIEFDHVSKVYPNGTVGLRDINLTIKEGELVVIVGLSGAGKSTFLRSINRLNEISSGEIRVGGQSVTRAAGRQLRLIRRDIGMVFQNFNLIKRQNEARVILADEPVASLDPLTTRQVMDDLKRINREMNITTVINLHFIDLAREYATRIIGLRAGEVVFDGTPEEATDEALAEIYGRPVLKDELLGGVS
ncbi:hypothetical protein BGX30_003774, partial [Mortierella sp. GBA39]